MDHFDKNCEDLSFGEQTRNNKLIDIKYEHVFKSELTRVL